MPARGDADGGNGGEGAHRGGGEEHRGVGRAAAAAAAEVEEEIQEEHEIDEDQGLGHGMVTAEEEEGRKAVGVKGPMRVSKEEREEHERTHLPYRSWCEICVKGRARKAPPSQTEQGQG